MFTVTFVLYEKDGLDRTEALRYWRETHGPLLREVPGVQRYVQQHAVGAPDGAPPFLGVASLSFADAEAFGAAVCFWKWCVVKNTSAPPSVVRSASGA